MKRVGSPFKSRKERRTEDELYEDEHSVYYCTENMKDLLERATDENETLPRVSVIEMSDNESEIQEYLEEEDDEEEELIMGEMEEGFGSKGITH